MVSPVNVTTEMVIKCASDSFKKEYPSECSSIVEKSFPVFIDYDADWLMSDGCHGTDMFFNDDPIVWQFTKYTNGDVTIEGLFNDYLMPATGKNAGKIEQLDGSKAVVPLYGESVECEHSFGYGCAGSAYYVDASFHQCYMESESLNTSLDDEMKDIVEKLFMGLKTQFPETYDSSLYPWILKAHDGELFPFVLDVPAWETKIVVPEQGK
jgi:hypothetical protein